MKNIYKRDRNYSAKDLSVAKLLRGDIFGVVDSLSSRPNTTSLVISTYTLRVSEVLPGEISY